ncbi:hypothetical protein K474DRAFT_1698276, partial [Panus rudis PR-1116 ss-1]
MPQWDRHHQMTILWWGLRSRKARAVFEASMDVIWDGPSPAARIACAAALLSTKIWIALMCDPAVSIALRNPTASAAISASKGVAAPKANLPLAMCLVWSHTSHAAPVRKGVVPRFWDPSLREKIVLQPLREVLGSLRGGFEFENHTITVKVKHALSRLTFVVEEVKVLGALATKAVDIMQGSFPYRGTAIIIMSYKGKWSSDILTVDLPVGRQRGPDGVSFM